MDVAEIRANVEKLKTVFTPELTRQVIEDFCNYGDCFIDMRERKVLPAGSIIVHRGAYEIIRYEQKAEKGNVIISGERVIHLRVESFGDVAKW